MLKKKSTKNDYSGYLNNLKQLGVELIGNSKMPDWDIFDRKSLLLFLEDVRGNKTTPIQTQKLLQLLTLYYFVRRYENKLNVKL